MSTEKLTLENFKSYYPSIPIFFTFSEQEVTNKKCEIQTDNYNNLNLNDYIIICFKNGNTVNNVTLDIFGYAYQIDINSSQSILTKEEEFAILAKVTRLSIDDTIGQIQFTGLITQGSFNNENPAAATLSSENNVLKVQSFVGVAAQANSSADMVIGDIPYYRTETEYNVNLKECVPLLGAGVILQVGSLVLIYVEKGHKSENKQLSFKISGSTYQSINYLDLDMSCYIVVKITELSDGDAVGKCLTMKIVNNDIGVAAGTALKIQDLMNGKKLSHKDYFTEVKKINQYPLFPYEDEESTKQINLSLGGSFYSDAANLDEFGHIKNLYKQQINIKTDRNSSVEDNSAEIRNIIIVSSTTDLETLDVPVGTIVFVKG